MQVKVETAAEGAEAGGFTSPTTHVKLTERQQELLRRMEARCSALPEPTLVPISGTAALQPEVRRVWSESPGSDAPS